ncbi:MAG: ABC transporter substrate-binding protein [Eubacteriales bacterium]
MKKLLSTTLTVMLLVSLCLGLTACNSSTSSDNSDSTASLEVWVRNTYYDEVVAAAANFQEDTGIEVTVVEPSDMSDDLALALSSGEEPDIISMDCVLIPYYASIGALQDITEEFNSLDYADQFSGGLIDLATYEDSIYAVPFSPEPSVLLYNKELFAAAGLDPDSPPTSWDELIEYAQACTTDDCWGYLFTASDAGGMMFTFGPYLWSAGGDFTSNGGTESALDSDEVASALQLIYDMIYTYEVTPTTITSYDWTACEDAFKSQNAAMVVLGIAAATGIVDEIYDFDAGCAVISGPDGETFSSFSGGDSLTILDSTEYTEEAWMFIDYCLSEEVQVDLLAATGSIPARLDMFDNDIFAGNEVYEVLQDALEVGQAPYSIKYNEMYTPWIDAIQYALNQEKTVEEALSDAKIEIDAILSE